MINKKAKLKENLKDLNIGGKEIFLERRYTIGNILDMNLLKMNIAMTNFVIRRTDFVLDENEDRFAYYGHAIVDDFSLGYFVAEDEIEFIEE